MKTSKGLIKMVAIGFVACAISLTACKKKKSDDAVEPDPDLSTERDISNADNDNNSLLRDIDKVYDNSSLSNLRSEAIGYATISRKDSTQTIEGITYDKYVLLTYTGTADDGQSRSGVVSIFSKGSRLAGDFQALASFSRTKVGGRSISGTKKITQQASGDANKWQFAIVANGTITTIEGKSITYTSNRTRVRLGISTLGDISDDSFAITGSWTGTNGNGESVSSVISAPLQLAYSCNYFREITAGKIDFTNSSKGVTRSVDYGSGGCDGKGTFINAKGKAFTFYFKR
jgi:hypothetical protein